MLQTEHLPPKVQFLTTELLTKSRNDVRRWAALKQCLAAGDKMPLSCPYSYGGPLQTGGDLSAAVMDNHREENNKQLWKQPGNKLCVHKWFASFVMVLTKSFSEWISKCSQRARVQERFTFYGLIQPSKVCKFYFTCWSTLSIIKHY